MHELSVCQALVSEVASVARAERASVVSEVYVSVGPLSGVEKPLMRNAFPIAAAGTIAADANLHLQSMPVRVACDACGIESEVPINRLVCSHCGDWKTRLVSGDEMLLERVVFHRRNLGETNDV